MISPNFDLGQHFMTDTVIINKIIKSVPKNKVVLEVGPGKGALSFKLFEKSKKLFLIEKDIRFKKYLKGLKVIWENALDIKPPKFDVLVSNLSFSITEPLIMKIMQENFEVAFLTISSGTYKKINENKTKFPYIINKFFDVGLVMDIDRKAFNPRPRTDACFIRIVPKEKNLFLEFLKRHDKKTKNAILSSLKESRTKRESRDLCLTINPVSLEKRVRNLTLQELKKIEEKLNEEERNIRRKKNS